MVYKRAEGLVIERGGDGGRGDGGGGDRGRGCGDEYLEGSGNGRRIFASDEDRAHWVAEPGIDRKASDFIAKYYATRVTDSQCQYVNTLYFLTTH